MDCIRLPHLAATSAPGRTAALLLLAAALPGGSAAAQSGDRAGTDVPGALLGSFVDDYGIEYRITEASWQQGDDPPYTVASWQPGDRSVLLSRTEPDGAQTTLWTRVDWVALEGAFPWGFCYAVYDAASREEALSGPDARRDTPRTGCNGFPFSRMRAVAGTGDRVAISVERDLAYARTVTDSVWRLDVYAPDSVVGAPVVVSLHGGSGSKDDPSYAEVSHRLAERGMVVFNASFRPGSPRSYAAEGGRAFREVLESVRCAIRFAEHRAERYGGSPARITVLGQSAGGYVGLLAALAGEEVVEALEVHGRSGDGPGRQAVCEEAPGRMAVRGFVGFNGAYFVFPFFGLPEEDPALWAIVNPERWVDRAPSLVTRFILGSNDATQPAAAIERAEALLTSRRALGYDAESVWVDARHGYALEGTGWDETLAVILSVAEGR